MSGISSSISSISTLQHRCLLNHLVLLKSIGIGDNLSTSNLSTLLLKLLRLFGTFLVCE